MLEERFHGWLMKTLSAPLLCALLGVGIGVEAGRAGQLQGETFRNRAKSAADAASGQSFAGMPEDARGKRAPARTREKQPGSPQRRALVLMGLRDPFKLPPPPGQGGQQSTDEIIRGPLPPGTRGLLITQLRLGGVVRLDQSNTMIAVVTNYTNRAYFLRENDAVYNGVVSRISPDSITFKENYLDRYGRAQVREVVKRLSGAPGEAR